MGTTFLEESTQIAGDFIRTICFIDDEPFFRAAEKLADSDLDHSLDANSITKSFADLGKSCTFFLYQKEEEEDSIIKLAANSDINVVDWRIKFDEVPTTQDLNLEDDVEEQESRGRYALKIIERIVTGQTNSPKLIVILTGESDGDAIFSALENKIEELGISMVSDESSFSFHSAKYRISIFFKEAVGSRKPNAEVKAKVVNYNKLPDTLFKEFALLTNGLIPNTALKAITVLRDNTATLLNLFNKKLDPAYLGHRVSLPNQDDAEELVVDLIKDSIGDLLHYYNVKSTLCNDQIQKWIDENVQSSNVGLYGLDDSKKEISLEESLDINNALTKKIIEEGTKGFRKIFSAFPFYAKLNANKATEGDKVAMFKRFFELNPTFFFKPILEESKKVDADYAILTHHKSILKPITSLPKLTLGSVIQGIKTKHYWVCIQQRCDSVRLEGTERRFLFLPLEGLNSDSSKSFQFITLDKVKLQLQKRSFNLRTIKFKEKTGEEAIVAKQSGKDLLFEPFYWEGHGEYKEEKDEVYRWVFDLKDLHAQRIANDFAHELSRVGLDESEWLRRWAGK